MTTAPVPLDQLLAHRPWVRALARTLVSDAATADDIEQQTWTAATRSPPREAATARAWLGRVTRNFARERHREEARRRSREEAVARSETDAVGAGDVVAQADLHKRVVNVVMALDEPYRTAVLMRFFEAHPPREIARRLDVPVETVRTRLKRALALLRGRLDDEHRGDRRVWVAAFAPLACADMTSADMTGADMADTAPPGSGGSTAQDSAAQDSKTQGTKMTPLLKLAATALVAALSIGAVLSYLAPPSPEPVPPESATPETAGARTARDRTRTDLSPNREIDGDTGAMPADEQDGAGEESGEMESADDAAAAEGSEERPAALPGELAMRIRSEPAALYSGEAFEIVTTFENRGPGPLKLFIPHLIGPFPGVRLTAEDGSAYVQAPFMGQVMVEDGIQGTIVELAAGATHEVRDHVWGVQRAGADSRTQLRNPDPPVLPDGRYVVTARHTQKTNKVPFLADSFAHEYRAIEGLWTGTVSAPDLALLVQPSRKPDLKIEAPEQIVPGQSYVVAARLRNPGSDDLVLSGSLNVFLSSKGVAASGFVRMRIEPTTAVLGTDEMTTYTVPAGETRTFTVDLLNVPIQWRSFRKGTKRSDLHHLPPKALVALSLQWRSGAETVVGSNSLFVRMADAPDVSETGLRLRIARIGGGELPEIEVRLENEGSETLHVPEEPASVIHLTLDVTRKDGGRVSRPSSPGLKDAEAPPALVSRDLLPGEVVTGRVKLAERLKRLAPGGYELRATWRNLRAGDGPTPRLVGRVVSEAIEFWVSE